MTPSNHSSRLIVLSCLITALVLTLSLTACGSGGDGDASQESPVLKVSDVSTLGSPSSPVIVYNDQGDGVAFWEVSTIVARWLYYSLYDHAADSWSAGKALTVVADNYSSLEPQVISNGTGYAVVWRLRRDSIDELYASLYDGDAWSAPEIIGGGSDYWGIRFQLASNGTGYAVAWDQDDGSGDVVYVNLSPDGSSWDGAVAIDHSPSAGLPRVASNDTGYAVVWTSLGNLAVRLYTESGWSTTVYLNDETSNPIHGHHQIASNGSGYSVIWSGWDGSEANLWSRTYHAADVDGWSGITPLYTGEDIISGAQILSNGTGYAVSYAPLDSELHAVVNPAGDAQWTQSTLLEPAYTDFTNCRMATDGNSYAIAWRRSNGSSAYDTYASVHDGIHWITSGSPIETGNLDSSQVIQLAGHAGRYSIAWDQSVGDEISIFARVYSTDVGWGETDLLETGLGDAHQPSIAVHPLDGITVAWNQFDVNEEDLASYTNHFNGSEWSGVSLLSVADYYVGSSYFPQLITNGNGKTLAVWIQDRNGKRALYANLFEAGAWGSAELLEASNTDNHPKIATDGNGFAVVWQATDETSSYTYNDTSFYTYVSIYDGSKWDESELLGRSVRNGFVTISSAAVASNGNGYVMVYRLYDGSTGSEKVYGRYFDGESWSLPVILSDDLFNTSGFSQVVSNGKNYLAIWNQYDGTNDKLYSSEFDGLSWSAPQLITSELYSFYTDVPHLESNGDNYLVVWFEEEKVMGRFYSGNWESRMMLGENALNTLYQANTPYLISNGVGYAVAWLSQNDIRSLVTVNVYDGAAWSGPMNIYSDDVYQVSFDMLWPNNLLAAAGDHYAVIWGGYDGTTQDVHDVYTSRFDGENWSAAKLLDAGSGKIVDFQLAGDEEGFLAAWLQEDGAGNADVVTNRTIKDLWRGANILDNNSQAAFQLNLIGDWDGYGAIWTQAEPDGDQAVRFPWARIGF